MKMKGTVRVVVGTAVGSLRVTIMVDGFGGDNKRAGSGMEAPGMGVVAGA